MKKVLFRNNLTQSFVTVSGAVAATVASTQASVVQITLTGNKLTNISNTLNADVTGDGTDDIILGDVTVRNNLASVYINGSSVWASFRSGNSFYHAHAKFASEFASGYGVADVDADNGAQNIKYLNPISFTDARINGGVSTQGYLEVNAFNTNSSLHTVALTRLVFDDASTTLGTSGLSTSTNYTEFVAAAVPEPSSFGLLALGAGGLVARRRRQAA